MPEEGIESIGHSNVLSLEQILRTTQLASRLGIRKVRFTGGEPLVRKNITWLVANVAAIEQIDDISLTTNGVVFAGMAKDLQQAGLNRVNFSLDSLVPDKFTYITRWGKISDVLEAISAALTLGMPVKVNTVIIRGFNDDEILDFVQLASDLPIQVRFIEFMPIGDLPFFQEKRLMSVTEMQEAIASRFTLRPIPSPYGGGPANCCQIDGGQGTVGFISAMSSHFCFDCNRIRLTADGKLRSCLFDKRELDLKQALDTGASDEQVLELLREAILAKPDQHHMDEGWGADNARKMVQIGG